MKDTKIHLHKNRINQKRSIYLLIIPALIFVLILVILAINLKSYSDIAQSTTNTQILGESDELIE